MSAPIPPAASVQDSHRSDLTAAQPTLRVGGLGPWPGSEARLAATAGFGELDAGLPPVPLLASSAAGGTAWAVDSLGFAASLLTDLDVDVEAGLWRLAPGRGRDVRRERARTAQALEACEEIGAGFEGRTLLSVLGPWTLLANLRLPSGHRVLSDPGAVRDVIVAYATGLETQLKAITRALGVPPRVRICEWDLGAVLSGRLPTLSGLHALPAVAENSVTVGLQSFLRRTGPDTLVSLTSLEPTVVGGKPLRPTDVLHNAGARALAVPLPPREPAAWDHVAEAFDAGWDTWLTLPARSGEHLHELRAVNARLTEPWMATGMSRASAAQLGLLAGCELPPVTTPLLPPSATPDSVRNSFILATRLALTLKEDA